MILLASTSDLLRVTSTATSEIDVHADFIDLTTATGAVTPGRTNTKISSATTTTLVASPGSGVVRNVKNCSLANVGAAANTLTIIHTDGTTAVTIWTITLQPGECAQYVEEVGWFLTTLGNLSLAYFAPANPTGNVSTTEKAMGLGATCVLTPTVTGKVLIEWQGMVFNSTAAGDGTNVTARWGTGTAPVNGATAGLGTVAGPTQHFVASTTAGKQGFSIVAAVTGLTLGTQVWFDLSLLAVTGGGSSVQDLACCVQERY